MQGGGLHGRAFLLPYHLDFRPHGLQTVRKEGLLFKPLNLYVIELQEPEPIVTVYKSNTGTGSLKTVRLGLVSIIK